MPRERSHSIDMNQLIEELPELSNNKELKLRQQSINYIESWNLVFVVMFGFSNLAFLIFIYINITNVDNDAKKIEKSFHMLQNKTLINDVTEIIHIVCKLLACNQTEYFVLTNQTM